MKYDFISIGDVTTDAFIKLKNASVWNDAGIEKLCMNFGDKLEYEKVDIIHGVGNSANAAVASARVGLNTAIITNIGKDERGSSAKQIWQNEKISLEFVTEHEDIPTHYHFIMRFGAERTILIKHENWPYLLPQFPEAPKWIYFSSIGEGKEHFHHEVAEFIKANPNTKLAFQPGTFQIALGIKKIKKLYENTEIFFCNKEEAERILAPEENIPQTQSSTEHIINLIKLIQKNGPKIVVITDGPRGAFAGNQNAQFYHIPMYPDIAPPKDRTGAGDAFSSTVVAFLAKGMPLEDALLRGPINSMNVVQHIGAQAGLLSTDEIERLLQSAPAGYNITTIA